MGAPSPVSFEPPKEEVKPFGQIGYEAYAKFTGGKTFDGRDMPLWKDITPKIQDAWCEASVAILMANNEEIRKHLEKKEA